jgi:hypothetical protein
MRANEFPDWNLEALNALPNMRQFQPAPHRHHTAWSIFPRNNDNRLPSLEALFSIADHASRDRERREKIVQQLSCGDTVQLENQRPISRIRQVLDGRSTTPDISKPMVDSLMTGSEWEEYTMYAHKVAYQIYQPRATCELVRLSPEVHVIPGLTKQEIQRAPSPYVSTALGAIANRDLPLQLWIVWPSTELHRLAKCYGDTNTAILHLDHGCFFIQMSGETVAVPANSPYAVFALQDHYSIGHHFNVSALAHDPPALHVDLACKLPMEDACEKRIKRLACGLRDKEARQAHVDQFVETWSTEAVVFRDIVREQYFDRLVEVWVDDIDWEKSCAWCSYIGLRSDQYLGTNHFGHVTAHLEGRVPE